MQAEEIFVLPDQLLEFRVREGEKNASAKTPQTVSLIAQELRWYSTAFWT